MLKNQSHSPARRRFTRSKLSIGAALGILVATGLSSAALAISAPPESVATASATEDSTVRASNVTLVNARTVVQNAAAITADVQNAGLDLGVETPAVDVTALAAAMDDLRAEEEPSVLLTSVLTANVKAQTRLVSTQTTDLRVHLAAAIAQKATDDTAARVAAEAAAAAEAAQLASLAAGNTPDGARATAQQIMANEYGWGSDQFSCLNSLWQKESGWNYQAYNANGGATGIPQALPGSKMASAGSDWQSNATTQIRWGLGYIQGSYGSPCAAWGHSQSVNWY